MTVAICLGANLISAPTYWVDALTLTETIAMYRAGWETYLQMDDEECDAPNSAASTFRPFWNKLINWASPATSHEEAMEALKLAHEFADDESSVTEPMIRAAIQYLDKKH